jgi:hypothetical protein
VIQILASLGLITVGDETAWAVTSLDDRYRYILGRMWDDYFPRRAVSPPRPLWVYGMLNPSKARGRDVAGQIVNDATIRKCEGFAKRSGAGGFLVVNLMAYSETYPDELVRAYEAGVDVCGEYNSAALAWALRLALTGYNIAAWGKIPPKLRSVAQSGVIQFKSSAPDCFGINLDGSPRHPLMLAYDTPIVRWQ